MNIKCEFISSSDLNFKGRKSDLILNICKHLKASEYITGMGSKILRGGKVFKRKNYKFHIKNQKIMNMISKSKIYSKFIYN